MKPFGKPIIFLLLSLLISCNNQHCKDGVNGTFRDLSGLDGCGMVIELENDKTIIPINLEEFDLEFPNGTKVVLNYTVQQDMMGICMAGEIVTIDCIKFN